MINPTLIPATIKQELDKIVCGQEYAKTVFSVGVYKHLVRLANPEAGLEKSNIIVLGPTGCGKTEILRSLKKILKNYNIDVPVFIADGSSFTESGVRGSDPQEILVSLINTYGIDKAQKAIVFIDEFDKKCCYRNNKSKNTADQYAILKMIEGTSVDLTEYKLSEVEAIDTSNILFVLGGAFTGIENIIAARIGEKNKPKTSKSANVLELPQKTAVRPESIDYNSVIDYIEPVDLLRFGVMREVLGRLPSIAVLKSLSRKDFEAIARSYYDREYAEIFANERIVVEFSQDAIEAIAEEAEAKHLGARAIKSILDPLLLDLMYDKVNPNQSRKRCIVQITKNDILKYQQHDIAC